MKRLLARLALCLVLQGLLVVASGVTASSSVCDAPRRASVASRGEG